MVLPNVDGELADPIEVTRVSADPDRGFEYPYFLSAPARPVEESPRPLLVQPNNTGEATDDYQRHLEDARQTARRSSGRRIGDRLLMPLLVPAFPRPESDPVDYTHDVHQLDTETMGLREGPLANVDEQLLAMAADARRRLRDRGYPVEEGLALNGFSASGQFVNRFTALHPGEVRSVTAGGINGMPILPREEADGYTLNYQLGVADLEELTGEPFDREAFAAVDQFLYLGELDGSDTIGFRDSWSPEQEQKALEVYGHNMQRDRFPYAKSVYERVSHTTFPVLEDLIEFHRRALEGGDTGAFGGNVGDPEPPEATFTVATSDPSAGEAIRFDAGGATA
ncbi:PKD domain-containing protein, partial [Halobacteriales archaeon QH_10_67_13]